jgi:sucrose synthase
MIDELSEHLHAHRDPLYLFFHGLFAKHEGIVTQSDFQHAYQTSRMRGNGEDLAGSPAEAILLRVQEGLLRAPMLYLAIREKVARWRYVEVHTEVMECRELSVSEYLATKEHAANGGTDPEGYTLEVDLTPFERGFPKVEHTDQIGRGVEYLNQYLSDRLLERSAAGLRDLSDFLRVHEVNGRPLMVNDSIIGRDDLPEALRNAQAILDGDENADWKRDLARLGFEDGWGDSRERIAESLRLLAGVLENPRPDTLSDFLDRVPMIFNIAIVSPHGFFGQANVLGKPDTGGQVVYILDQVRALEEAMCEDLERQGLDVKPNIVVLSRLIPEAEGTSCDLRVEPIVGTQNARILRVPFRDEHGDTIPHWISRFEIWPYLERFAQEAERELLAELGSRPDFVIGNYSDGNLVATLLSESLGVTQCTIAHALEKTKYAGSDIKWAEQEQDYHFSCQFTADLIAMNTADFIITSTYQEIAGTDQTVGQYESHQSFTLPGLYRVISGIDCFDPKFNIVSPGADPHVFFPYREKSRRPERLVREVEDLVLGDSGEAQTRGSLADPDKRPLFAMSRLDPIKNMASLVRWYAESPAIQERANLLLVGGTLDPEASDDRDERRQIELMHELLSEHALDERVRWIEMQTDRNTVGGLYRFVADRGGAFVQPALFEAFGLTVVEAMASGLPTFATQFGGPLEIIEDGVSGFHIDPTSDEAATEVIERFLARCDEDESEWTRVSDAAIDRIEARYTWKLYADRLLRLSRIYGFWRHLSSLEREETRRYLEMFYALMYRPRAATLLTPGA